MKAQLPADKMAPPESAWPEVHPRESCVAQPTSKPPSRAQLKRALPAAPEEMRALEKRTRNLFEWTNAMALAARGYAAAELSHLRLLARYRSSTSSSQRSRRVHSSASAASDCGSSLRMSSTLPHSSIALLMRRGL